MTNANQHNANQKLAQQQSGKEQFNAADAPISAFRPAFKRLPLLTATTQEIVRRHQVFLSRSSRA